MPTLALARGRGIPHPRMGDWFNRRRLLEPIGNIPPAKAEALYYAAQENLRLAV